MTALDTRPIALPEFRDAAAVGTRIDAYDGVGGSYGAQLRLVRERSAAFRRELVSTGMPDSVVTKDLVTLPYPTRFGLWRAARTPSPYLSITNRMLVVRWTEGDATKT